MREAGKGEEGGKKEGERERTHVCCHVDIIYYLCLACFPYLKPSVHNFLICSMFLIVSII